jgi:hypothetical protein
MEHMFYNSDFYCDISKWNVHNVINTEEIFNKSKMARKKSYKPKFNINEAFDFNSINKKKESINLYKSLPQILEKVKNFNIADITPNEYNILISCIGVYKVTTTE